jgi:hypothetical protein
MFPFSIMWKYTTLLNLMVALVMALVVVNLTFLIGIKASVDDMKVVFSTASRVGDDIMTMSIDGTGTGPSKR